MNLLNAAKELLGKGIMKVSVLSHQYDEVYGSLGAEGLFTEITA
jgi:hypothetical protein